LRQTPSIVPHLQRVEAGILFLTFTGPLRKQTHASTFISLTIVVGMAGALNRDRGAPRGAAPPTPPGIRVRTTAVRRIKR
jgi:hypothetical protein